MASADAFEIAVFFFKGIFVHQVKHVIPYVLLPEDIARYSQFWVLLASFVFWSVDCPVFGVVVVHWPVLHLVVLEWTMLWQLFASICVHLLFPTFRSL